MREFNPLVKNELMGCTGGKKGEGAQDGNETTEGCLSGGEAIECGR